MLNIVPLEARHRSPKRTIAVDSRSVDLGRVQERAGPTRFAAVREAIPRPNVGDAADKSGAVRLEARKAGHHVHDDSLHAPGAAPDGLHQTILQRLLKCSHSQQA